jgi:hypothetical protein
LNDSITPRASIVMMASTAVSRIARARASLSRSARSVVLRRVMSRAIQDVADRRRRQRHVDHRAAAPRALRFERLHQFPAADGLGDPGRLVRLLRRGEHAHVAPTRLVGRVAEDPLGAAVPGDDRAVELQPDDRVVRVLDDGGELGVGLLGAASLRDLLPEPAQRRVQLRRVSQVGLVTFVHARARSSFGA